MSLPSRGGSGDGQSVSVVPTIVRAPAGNTKNSRLSRGERSTSTRPLCGTRAASNTRCTPSVGRRRGAPLLARKLSVNGPGRADHDGRARFQPRAGLAVHERGAANPAVTVAQQGGGANVIGDGRAGRLGVEHVLQHQARVVGLAVDVGLRALEPGAAQLRRQLVELVGAAACGCRRAASTAPARCRGGCRCPASPASGVRRGRRGTGTPPAGTGGARCASGCAARRAPRTPAAGRRTAGSEARRGSAWTTGWTSRRRSRPRRPARRPARAAPRRARSRRRSRRRRRSTRRSGASPALPAPRAGAPEPSFLERDVQLVELAARHRSGSSVIRSVPFCVLGNAITSRSDSAPLSSIARRSSPSAMPPCGGGPYLNASSRKPNFARASSSLMPSARNTRACTSGRWIRIEPPAISMPLSTRS